MKVAAAVRITCEARRDAAREARDALRELDVWDVTVQPGRAVALREARRAESLFRAGGRLEEDRCEVIYANVPRARCSAVLARVVERARLDIPGRGSAYAEEIRLHRPPTAPLMPSRGLAPAGERFLLADLAAITCIVLRGEANAVARLALELGTAVPVVTFGEGTGLRDRLGLLRVTIPAEKEIVSTVVPARDAPGIAAILADEARLDQPGRGFLYLARIGRGLLNTRIYVGPEHHAASMAQVVAAIDALRGGTSWRSRFAPDEITRLLSRGRLVRGMANLTVHCNEGHVTALVDAAMEAGASGATTMRIRHLAGAESPMPGLLSVREKTSLIVPAATAPRVIGAMERAGLYGAECAGQIEESDCPAALTYARRAPRGSPSAAPTASAAVR